MKFSGKMLMAIFVASALSACGGDKKDSADRAQEAQKAIQEGMQKEKQMYEGMQKGVETLKEKAEGKKEESKK